MSKIQAQVPYVLLTFDRLQEYMPEIKQTGIRVKSEPFLPLIDSSDVDPSVGNAWGCL